MSVSVVALSNHAAVLSSHSAVLSVKSAGVAAVASAAVAERRFKLLLRIANTGLALAMLVLIATVLICYPFEAQFSMAQLIAGHLSMIASATLVKICYVGRCVAQYGLQQEVR